MLVQICYVCVVYVLLVICVLVVACREDCACGFVFVGGLCMGVWRGFVGVLVVFGVGLMWLLLTFGMVVV